jgi:DNA-binding protein H-NS
MANILSQTLRLRDDVRYDGQRKFHFHPKYRSKIDPNVTWSGQGRLPKWMQEEMNGTHLSKKDFRIVRLDAEGF